MLGKTVHLIAAEVIGYFGVSGQMENSKIRAGAISIQRRLVKSSNDSEVAHVVPHLKVVIMHSVRNNSDDVIQNLVGMARRAFPGLRP